MSENKNRNNLFSFIKSKGTLTWIVVLVIAGILLLWLGSGTSENRKSDVVSSNDRLEKYTESLEKKIAELCSKVSGAGNVSVTVYLDSGFETVYAYNEESKTSSSGTNSEKKYVTLGSGNEESMVCISERAPNICGVAVVCTGGGNSRVVEDIIGIISSAYGVSKNKIYVAEGKK